METMWRKALLIGRWLLPYIRNAAPVTLVLGVVALLVATWWLGPRLEIHGEYPLMAWQMRALVTSARICQAIRDRKSTRLNSSHVRTSYAVFRLKKKSV